MKMKGVQEGAGMNLAKKKQADEAGRPKSLAAETMSQYGG